MHIKQCITAERCLLGGQVSSRKKALQLAASVFAQQSTQLDAFIILKAMVAREQLGSTAIGNGIALPHARIANCEIPQAVFLTLQDGVDFHAPDQEDVDIVFALIVPEDFDYAEIRDLNDVITIFKDKTVCAQCRNAHNNEALFEILTHALEQRSKNKESVEDKKEAITSQSETEQQSTE
ncbi:MAG: PTS sugar transporter subunit IIA [Kangiellaceae bacterium]|nr:PTS sugar transporter subunit IIA [Kangiellaceae bacterium]